MRLQRVTEVANKQYSQAKNREMSKFYKLHCEVTTGYRGNRQYLDYIKMELCPGL